MQAIWVCASVKGMVFRQFNPGIRVKKSEGFCLE